MESISITVNYIQKLIVHVHVYSEWIILHELPHMYMYMYRQSTIIDTNGVEAEKRDLQCSAYYKNFQEGVSKSTCAIKMYA